MTGTTVTIIYVQLVKALTKICMSFNLGEDNSTVLG